jgi:hypothetical protein
MNNRDYAADDFKKYPIDFLNTICYLFYLRKPQIKLKYHEFGKNLSAYACFCELEFFDQNFTSKVIANNKFNAINNAAFRILNKIKQSKEKLCPFDTNSDNEESLVNELECLYDVFITTNLYYNIDDYIKIRTKGLLDNFDSLTFDFKSCHENLKTELDSSSENIGPHMIEHTYNDNCGGTIFKKFKNFFANNSLLD